MSRNNITPVMMLTPGQALGAYALRRFPCGVVFIISSIFSIFILGISIALNQYASSPSSARSPAALPKAKRELLQYDKPRLSSNKPL